MTQPRYVMLYDGHCRLCTEGSRRLEAWMRPGSVERLDFQQPGVLERFPGLTHEMCMERMYLIAPDGRRYAGAEGIARAIATRPILGKIALLYYLPGLKQLLDALYKLIAANRYRLLGKCENGMCHPASHRV